MQWITRGARAVFLALALFTTTASAALPDPITLAWAVERGDIRKVRSWLDEGLDAEAPASQFGSGLAVAAWHGNIEMMALFIERGANPRRANRAGEQPLQLAAWNGHINAVKWLLENGAALNREGNYWGALHYAVFNGHSDLANYLIERGAHIDARSPNGSTPLMMAAREGREDLSQVLLKAGADVRATNDWGDNALALAMRYDHYQLGKMISSAEEFALAVKAPKETFGEPTRSAAAPSDIETLLQKLRAAEAEARPADEIRQELAQAVETFRRYALAQRAARRPMPLPYESRSILITAKRGKPGVERAQVVAGPQAAAAAAKRPGKATAVVAPARPSAGDVADLMRQIRLVEAQGRPATELRRQLYDAVDKLKP